MNCSICGNVVVKDGIRETNDGCKQRWYCKHCNKYFSTPLENKEEELNSIKMPRILLLDIETSPLLAWVWGRWKQNVHLEQTEAESFILSWSAKWLMSAEIMSARLNGEETMLEDDSRILKPLWELINSADVLVGHYLNHFDNPRILSRFIINGFPPPNPYKTIDTKEVCSRQFGFSSNKLDALAGYFGFEKKLPTGFELWKRCMHGDDTALIELEIYNRHDVELLEEVYLKLRPWIRSHPNVGLYLESDVTVCSACGSKDMQYLPDEYYYTQVSKYPVFRCNSCGAITRGRKTALPKEINKILGTSVPR